MVFSYYNFFLDPCYKANINDLEKKLKHLMSVTFSLHEKCPNTEFFSGPYFPVIGLNTEIYGVNFRIQPG